MRASYGGNRARIGCAVLWLWSTVWILVSPITTRAAAPPEPQITATTAAVIDLATGSILWGRDIHVVRAPASLTKILTALVAVDLAPLDTKLTTQKADLIGESSMGLVAGETLPLEALLYGLLLPSGNDAAMTIARGLGAQPGDANAAASVQRFMDKMNAKARTLGAKETHLANPHGLDELNHRTSAYDLAIIGAAFASNPTLVKIAGTVAYEGYGHTLHNTNKLLYDGRYPSVISGKTGQTDEAGYNLIEIANKNGRKLLTVEMGTTADAFWTDSFALMDYGFAVPAPTRPQVAGQGGAFASNTGTDAVSNSLSPAAPGASDGTDSSAGGDGIAMIPLPPGARGPDNSADAPASPLDAVGAVALNLPLFTFTLPPPTTIDGAMGLRYLLLTALALTVALTLYLRRVTIRAAFTELREEWQAALIDPPHLALTGPIPRIDPVAARPEPQARVETVSSRFEEMGHSLTNGGVTVAHSYALRAVRQARAGKRVEARQAFAQVLALEPRLEWGTILGFWELPVTAYADLATVMIEAGYPMEARTMLTIASLAYPGHTEIRIAQALLPPKPNGPHLRAG